MLNWTANVVEFRNWYCAQHVWQMQRAWRCCVQYQLLNYTTPTVQFSQPSYTSVSTFSLFPSILVKQLFLSFGCLFSFSFNQVYLQNLLMCSSLFTKFPYVEYSITTFHWKCVSQLIFLIQLKILQCWLFHWTYVIKLSTDQGLLVMMPQVWNKLPYQVRTCTDKETFKKDLKTYFFDLYLNS